MQAERPDLSEVPEAVRAYVEALEAELARLQAPAAAPTTAPPPVEAEPPTTLQVITISHQGRAKRTARHYYSPQRRGGMGVFDLELPEPDRPAVLLVADVEETLLLFSDQGRAFRLPVAALPEGDVRARGLQLGSRLPLRQGERIVAALPAAGGVYVALLSERGWVRRVRSSFFTGSMVPGLSFHDVAQGGPLVAACWTRGQGDLFLATRQGQAIRFDETQVSGRQGRLGLRVARDDAAVAVAAVDEASGVFLLSEDGKGTIRLMSGFRANKAPGATGKLALKTGRLVGAVTAGEDDHLFVISNLSKIIRFAAAEIPPKEGVVQGVNVISLRADEAAAVAVSPAVHE